jgi:hypothetical protein
MVVRAQDGGITNFDRIVECRRNLGEKSVEPRQKLFRSDPGPLKFQNEGARVLLECFGEGSQHLLYEIACIQKMRIRSGFFCISQA